jgi:PKD repeat protein
MDVNGSISLSYCKSSSTVYPSLCFTGRLAGDPLGIMTFAETQVVAGASSQTGTNRYGDYSQTSLDPDGVTFWHTGEYIPSGGVRTRIYSFQLPAGNIAPTANFSANPTTTTCSSDVQFTDMSANSPDTWYWEFGDGLTSTVQNPFHTYLESGTYSVTLTCTNSFGTDTLIKPNYVTINNADNPVVTDGYGCLSETVILTASGNGELHWFDTPTGGTDLGTGSTFTTPVLNANATYYVENRIVQPSQYVGITSTNGASNSNYAYSLTFDCYSPVNLVSVKVYKTSAGSAVFQMTSSTGTILHSGTFTLPQGESTVTLNWDIDVGTDMHLGCTTSGFYRTNNGVSYPYTLAGFLSITGCNQGNTRYGPFYNWEIKPPDCISNRVPVVANIVASAVPSVSVITSDTIICDGGQASFTASPVFGGQTPSYLWFVNGFQAGSGNVFTTSQLADSSQVYCIMTSVLSCANPVSATSDTVVVDVDTTVISTVTISASENSICAGMNVTFTASAVNGGTSPAYTWYKNVTVVGSNSPVYSSSNLTDGDAVKCKVTSSLVCVSGSPAISNTETIVVYALPPTPGIYLSGDTLYSSAATGNQWYYSPAGIPVSGANGQFHVPTMIGDYFVLVTDTNGCVSDTSNIINVTETGMTNPGNEQGFIIYPNPSRGDFVIYLPGSLRGHFQYKIINALGQTLVQKDIMDNEIKISTRYLINGVYYIEIIGMKGNNVRKVIIQK